MSVGIKKIDDQHKRFMEIINSTNNKAKSSREQITDLLDYARTHFSTEELILEKYKYPFLEEHKREHLKLLEKLIELYDKSKAGEDINQKFTLFLKNWLEEHIRKYDFKYAKYFEENKIKVD